MRQSQSVLFGVVVLFGLSATQCSKSSDAKGESSSKSMTPTAACGFLSERGLSPGEYKVFTQVNKEDKCLCLASKSLDNNKTFLRYSVYGTKTTVQELRLEVSSSLPNGVQTNRGELLSAANALSNKAYNNQLPDKVQAAIRGGTGIEENAGKVTYKHFAGPKSAGVTIVVP